MLSVATELADWAVRLAPNETDLKLAELALLDTVVVAIAGRNEPAVGKATKMGEVGRWAVAGHILDYDDLHIESTTHVSVVCVPAVLAAGGGARAYLGAAGVMARLGTALGWAHYTAGWHATTTSGAPAAAVGAGLALGLDADQLATAVALAVPAAGGVQRAFGTDGKSLQVGFAVEAGVRAANLAAAGATADPSALDTWMRLVGGDPAAVDLTGPAVPGGLAVKAYPCCYALQRPISVLTELLRDGVDPKNVTRIVLRTPAAAVTPLIHHSPTTGLQAKFSLEYAAAAALLNEHPGFASFTDDATQRPMVKQLMDLIDVELSPGGDRLLDGELEAEVHVGDRVLRGTQKYPPGSPQVPMDGRELARKVADCLAGTGIEPDTINWSTAADILRKHV